MYYTRTITSFDCSVEECVDLRGSQFLCRCLNDTGLLRSVRASQYLWKHYLTHFLSNDFFLLKGLSNLPVQTFQIPGKILSSFPRINVQSLCNRLTVRRQKLILAHTIRNCVWAYAGLVGRRS